MKRVSIKDIARIAGVSVATVSYVLNKKEGNRISEATKEKILEVAETINYTPNKMAKSLKTNKSRLIGLILADISNDFYSTIARNIENEAMKLGYTLLIGSSDENPEKFKKLIELFSEQQVDGMIVAPVVHSDSILEKLIKEEYPVVTIDRYLNNLDIPGIMINNSEISEQICEFLVSKNFEEIIYIGYDTELPHLLDREKGFDKCMTSSRIPCEKILVGLENITLEVQNGIEKVIKTGSRKRALYFSSNKLAVAGLGYLIKHNINVPNDISVIAFDETEAYTLFQTEITYVKQPLEEMAAEAVKVLDHQIDNYIPSGKKIIFPAKLIEKKSVQ
jgi:LacI family transcriptional regulator